MRDGKLKRIFSGWMFAESPGLNALQHPVFDLWLTECASPSRTTASPRGGQPAWAGGAGRAGAARGTPARQAVSNLSRRGGRAGCAQPGGGPNTSTALRPPNANEFDIT